MCTYGVVAKSPQFHRLTVQLETIRGEIGAAEADRRIDRIKYRSRCISELDGYRVERWTRNAPQIDLAVERQGDRAPTVTGNLSRTGLYSTRKGRLLV